MAKSTPITLRLDTDMYKFLQDVAKREEIPVSFVIRRTLRKGLGIKQGEAPAEIDEKLTADWE